MNVRGWRAALAGREAVVLVACLALGPSALEGQPPQAASSFDVPDRVTVNDNRAVAGTQQDGILTVRLEARLGTWHPDRESDPGRRRQGVRR